MINDPEPLVTIIWFTLKVPFVFTVPALIRPPALRVKFADPNETRRGTVNRIVSDTVVFPLNNFVPDPPKFNVL